MRNFDSTYMKSAYLWAENSYARRAKVGAVIIKNGQMISNGFNGTPSGFENECEEVVGCECIELCPHKNCNKDVCLDCPHALLKTKSYVLHAEANAITKCAKTNTSSEGATIYVTLSPCIECAKLILQAGITRVVYAEEYRDTSGLDLLRRAGITVEKYDPEKE